MVPRKKYAIKEKSPIPKSGEYPMTAAAIYLQDRGWAPFKFDGEIKWIDPLKPYDISYSESEAVDLQLRRDDLKNSGRY